MNREPDFVMGINVPGTKPTPQEIEFYTADGRLEPFLKHMMDSGYLNREEVAAYVKFISEFAMFTPFIMDSFLEVYRGMKQRTSELVIPQS